MPVDQGRLGQLVVQPDREASAGDEVVAARRHLQAHDFGGPALDVKGPGRCRQDERLGGTSGLGQDEGRRPGGDRAKESSAIDGHITHLGSHSFAWRRRSALPITETELRLIAAAAMIGLKRMPVKG